MTNLMHSISNLILLKWEIYRDVIEFADMHPTKCVQQHVMVKSFCTLIFLIADAHEKLNRLMIA